MSHFLRSFSFMNINKSTRYGGPINGAL